MTTQFRLNELYDDFARAAGYAGGIVEHIALLKEDLDAAGATILVPHHTATEPAGCYTCDDRVLRVPAAPPGSHVVHSHGAAIALAEAAVAPMRPAEVAAGARIALEAGLRGAEILSTDLTPPSVPGPGPAHLGDPIWFTATISATPVDILAAAPLIAAGWDLFLGPQTNYMVAPGPIRIPLHCGETGFTYLEAVPFRDGYTPYLPGALAHRVLARVLFRLDTGTSMSRVSYLRIPVSVGALLMYPPSLGADVAIVSSEHHVPGHISAGAMWRQQYERIWQHQYGTPSAGPIAEDGAAPQSDRRSLAIAAIRGPPPSGHVWWADL